MASSHSPATPAAFRHKHAWEPIAQESDEYGISSNPKTWLWCIRCGCLKLGSQVFAPGKHQKKTIVPMERL